MVILDTVVLPFFGGQRQVIITVDAMQYIIKYLYSFIVASALINSIFVMVVY